MAFISSYHHIISPLGLGSHENFRRVTAGELPLSKITLPFSEEPFCVARIPDEAIERAFADTGSPVAHTRLEKLSLLSVRDVLAQSGLEANNPGLCLLYTTTKGNIDLLEKPVPGVDAHRVYLHGFAAHLQKELGLVHAPIVLSNACISGLLGIIVAKRLVEQGRYRHVLVCGGDILSSFTLSGFRSFNALSPEPCKPFDLNRRGINLGEAVATVLVTNDEVLAGPRKTHVLSSASANDANHISGPSRTGEGLVQAILQTMKGQHISPGFISAHGTATPYNDEMESIAFERTGLGEVPVNSLKGHYGHTLGAAGVLETVISLEALYHNTLTRSAGFDTGGVSGKISIIEKTTPTHLSAFLKTASGFGGCNAAALFAKA